MTPMKSNEELAVIRKQFLSNYFVNTSTVWESWRRGHISYKEREETLGWYRKKLYEVLHIERVNRRPGSKIVVQYQSLKTGFRTLRTFGSMAQARNYVIDKVGLFPTIEGNVAQTETDAVVVIGCPIMSLFPSDPTKE